MKNQIFDIDEMLGGVMQSTTAPVATNEAPADNNILGNLMDVFSAPVQ